MISELYVNDNGKNKDCARPYIPHTTKKGGQSVKNQQAKMKKKKGKDSGREVRDCLGSDGVPKSMNFERRCRGKFNDWSCYHYVDKWME